MSWLKKLIPSRIRTDVSSRTHNIPEGLWSNCTACSAILYNAELERSVFVCPHCQHHLRLGARQRLELFLDAEGRTELGQDVKPVDRLKFRDSKRYKDRLSAAQKNSGEDDAMVVMQGQVLGLPVVACCFEFGFIGGSMGAVVGGRFVQGASQALRLKIPFICFSTSGGARMQEAIISLMQMAKTSAVLSKLAQKRVPYISVMTDPTYGGVSASLAMLGDINIAEPGASIGFTGPRVIEQTVRETLPDDFQKSDFLLEHGMVDLIVDRRDMREKLVQILKNFQYFRQYEG